MRSFLQKFLILYCLLSPACCKCFAQEYIFNHLTTRDGLASNNILSLCQTDKGYLWIGTENGLQRYDGYHFTSPSTPEVAKTVNQVVEDNEGNMWLRMGNTIGIFNTYRFTFTEAVIEEDIAMLDPDNFELCRDADKKVFLLIRGSGCFYPGADKTTFSARHVPFRLPEGSKIFSVTDDSVKHRYWFVTDKGLGYFDKKTRQLCSYKNNPLQHPLLADIRFTEDISNFYIDSRRRYWVERWNHTSNLQEYYCFDEKTGVFNGDTLGLAGSGNGGYYEVHQFSEFNDTTVLLYGLNCMSMRENGRFTKFVYPDYSPYSIRFNVVHDVLEDREDIFWVATDDGLYNTMANISNNRHLMLGQDKGKRSINCLMQDDQKNIWIGIWERGILIVDTNLAVHQKINHLFKRNEAASKSIWAMHQQPATKKIWIGCQGGYLYRYDPDSRQLKRMHSALFNQRTIRQIEEDGLGRLWLGLQSGKLIVCEPGKSPKEPVQFREVHRFEKFIYKLKLDKRGNLWVAVSGNGIYVIDVKTGAIIRTFTAGPEPGSLSGNDIRDILPLNDSIYMLAGDKLNIMNLHSGKTKHISSNDNFPLGKVYTLQPGVGNECWISTANGIYRYSVDSGNLIRYSQWDGLITVFNQGYLLENSLRLKNNKLIFAGNQNFVQFDPARYKKVTVPPDVEITDFLHFDKYLPVDSIRDLRSLYLDHNENSFTIDFASLSFTQLEKLTYEYMLQGADQDWIKVKLPQPVKYSLLPPSRYRFMVRSKNSEGVYSKNITQLSIVILPPFWKTYWFYALIIAAVAGFLYYLHRLRLQRLLHVERVRSKLARDLHDDMGSTLSTINILSNMALQQTASDDRTGKKFMEKISENTVQMMESMDDIIWSINPLNDSMGKVLARMKQVAGTVLEAKGIDYSFEAEHGVKQLSFTMEWRREIFLVYKEAINNIVKYAQCTDVEVLLYKKAGSFMLTVKDNGIGFNTAAQKTIAPTRGNGIINMHKRAEAMKGALLITSEAGKGTQVTLSIPLA